MLCLHSGNMDESADFKHPEDFGPPAPADDYDYAKAAAYAEQPSGRYQTGAYGGTKYSPVPEGYAASAYLADVSKGGPTSDTFV